MKKLEVRFTASPGHERVVGQLAEDKSRSARAGIYFEYDARFLQQPLWLSPFKLPHEPGLHAHRDLGFGPIFGLFDDSLPDGWGLLLLDRLFKQQGSILAEVSVLDRLRYLGTRTMGALTYHPPEIDEENEAESVDLNELALASQRVAVLFRTLRQRREGERAAFGWQRYRRPGASTLLNGTIGICRKSRESGRSATQPTCYQPLRRTDSSVA